MNYDEDKISEVVKRIGNVDQLSTDQLIQISQKLFLLVSFCDCERIHDCNLFYHHDYEHSPSCKCCQKRMLLYYLVRGMEKLADEDKLPQFIEAHLSYARIRDRTYEHIRIGSEIIFSITRHLNAWRNDREMEEIIQTWSFNFTDLSLRVLCYDASTVGISVRKLMESRSEWKGTNAELLAELKKVAEALKIDTKSNLWPNSTHKLNQILQELMLMHV